MPYPARAIQMATIEEGLNRASLPEKNTNVVHVARDVIYISLLPEGKHRVRETPEQSRANKRARCLSGANEAS